MTAPARLGTHRPVAEEVFEDRVAGLPQPELAVGVDVRGVHAEVAAEAGLGGDEVEAGQDVEGEGERFGDAGHLAGEAPEDAAYLAVLLALQDGPLRAEAGHGSRFEEDR